MADAILPQKRRTPTMPRVVAAVAALLVAGSSPFSAAFQLHPLRYVSPQPFAQRSGSKARYGQASRWQQPALSASSIPPVPSSARDSLTCTSAASTRRGTALLASVTPQYAADLVPGIDAINSQNAELYDQLNTLRARPFFRLYSVDILASCEYIPQELFECYSESCEIYPVDDDEVSRGDGVGVTLMYHRRTTMEVNKIEEKIRSCSVLANRINKSCRDATLASPANELAHPQLHIHDAAARMCFVFHK